MVCEKCWAEAIERRNLEGSGLISKHYEQILKEKTNKPCTEKEQAGKYWDSVNNKDSRFYSPNKENKENI